MRLFENCVEAISEVTRDLFSRGQIVFDPTVQGKVVSRSDYEMKELLGYSYSILDGSDKVEMIEWAIENFPTTTISVEWAEMWFKERISGVDYNPPPSWKLRREYWEKFLNEEGKFDYTYCERMQDFDKVIEALRENKYRRGAFQTVYESPKDLPQTLLGKRVPCSIGYHFMIRPTPHGDRANVLYFMRSCDLINHFASDVYIAFRLMETVADHLGVRPGRLVHTISSLHAYIADVPKTRRW